MFQHVKMKRKKEKTIWEIDEKIEKMTGREADGGMHKETTMQTAEEAIVGRMDEKTAEAERAAEGEEEAGNRL